MEELDCRSVCRKTGVSPEAEMDIVTGVELECSYGAGDGWTRSGVASMRKERSGGPRLDWSCDWEKYGYDTVPLVLGQHVLLVSPASRTYFGHLKSIIRLEDSYLVVSVSPESSAYGPFIPESCHIHLPSSFISLPWTH